MRIPFWSWSIVAASLMLTAMPRAGAANPGDPRLAPPVHTRQMALVVTPDWNAVSGTLQRYERSTAGGPWRAIGSGVPVVVGSAGLAWGRGLDSEAGHVGGPVKREGDRRAPAGVFRLSAVFGYAASGREAGVRLPYLHLTDTTEGVDDTQSAWYNRIVDRHSIAHPDWHSAEKMRREDGLYRWGVVVDHNVEPAPVRGAGSCIFLHLWRGPGQGTVGCTAMEAAALKGIIRWLEPAEKPVLVQLPSQVYEAARGRGDLP